MPPRKKGKNKKRAVKLDSVKALERKCDRLASAIRRARHLVVYTGAGISTAAAIPDYRGPNGVWTLAKQGQTAHSCNPVHASPTSSHMALRSLVQSGHVRHIVSQNCDGLHLRSGVPQTHLSEIHGNMYIEVCSEPSCSKKEGQRQFVRNFDVTASTAFRKHKTGRKCTHCTADLHDTIVHFGEVGRVRWPLNWKGAIDAVEKTDVILCLGSSLQILKKYSALWCNDRPARMRPRLFIVNLEWTPKDRLATLKINAPCDSVLNLVMQRLDMQIPSYCRPCDPVFSANRRNCKSNNTLMNCISECSCTVDGVDDEEETDMKPQSPIWRPYLPEDAVDITQAAAQHVLELLLDTVSSICLPQTASSNEEVSLMRREDAASISYNASLNASVSATFPPCSFSPPPTSQRTSRKRPYSRELASLEHWDLTKTKAKTQNGHATATPGWWLAGAKTMKKRNVPASK